MINHTFAALTGFLLSISLLCTSTSHADGFLPDSQGIQQPEVLPAEQAFTYSVLTEGHTVFVDWFIAPECYLYKDRFQFKAITPLGERRLKPTFGPAKRKYDPHYEKELDVFYVSTRIALDTDGLPDEFDLEIKSQGCAEIGLCYPPVTRIEKIIR